MIRKILVKFGVTDKAAFKALFLQFVKFGIVGLSNTIVSLAVYYIVLWINPDYYMLGSVLGAILSILNAFIWNDLYVFPGNPKDCKSIITRLVKTYISYGGTSLLSVILMWVEVSVFSVDKAIAPIINLIITIPLNFIINKLWTFRKLKNEETLQ